MVKLPMSDYVRNYYKEQGIEFTLRQQAHFCWYYNDLLKDRINSLKEILAIPDDENLNAEIRERIAYEEKAYECFMTNDDPGCIYIFRSDNGDEYDEEYFSSAGNAVSYGIRHSDKEFTVEKFWLFDRNPKGLSGKGGDDDPESANEILSCYSFTSGGGVKYGYSHECPAPFDEEDKGRFENMFLNIKSPFGLGDIVMGAAFEKPGVVHTDHDCFEKIYDRHREDTEIWIDNTDNCITVDWIGTDGKSDHDHVIPFDLWKADSWEDEGYWEILQILSKAAKAGVSICSLDHYVHEYVKRHSGE